MPLVLNNRILSIQIHYTGTNAVYKYSVQLQPCNIQIQPCAEIIHNCLLPNCT